MEIERRFIAGKRIKRIREELGLVVSEFIELIDFYSERDFLEIEDERLEAGEKILKSISENTGASLAWLKHGRGDSKYVTGILKVDAIGESIEKIEKSCPSKIYATLDKEDNFIGFVTEGKGLFYKPFLVQLNINFLKGDTPDSNSIRGIHELLLLMQSKYSTIINCKFISRQDHIELYSGNTHAVRILKNGKHEGHSWLSDLLNIGNTNHVYGSWFANTQKQFRECLDMIKG